MPVCRGASRFAIRLSIVVVAALLLLSSGCFGLRRSGAARGSPEPAGMQRAPESDVAPQIKPPPPPIPDSPVSYVKDERPAADSPLKRLALKAIENEKKLGNYIVRIRRRELIDGRMQPDEVILLKYRRAPLSVHFKWLGDESHGREILYVQGRNENKIQLLTGKGDFLGPGHKMVFDPENPLVRSKSHYPITEAGLGAATLRFGALVDAIERGQNNAGTARYLGLQNRPEFPRPVEVVEQDLPPGLEPFLPRGGVRYYYFDETIGVPTVIVTFDTNRQEVEYYRFDRLQSPVNLDDSDFDPQALWGK